MRTVYRVPLVQPHPGRRGDTARRAEEAAIDTTQPPCDAVRMYSDRSDSYLRFVRAVLYPEGLRAFFHDAAVLRSGLRVLDAGCGTGIVSLALRQALLDRGFAPGPMHGFDLTPAMLDRFRATLAARGIEGIELAQADVLDLRQLPAAWNGYDLVVTASMFEYLPPAQVSAALAGLRSRLRDGGRLLLFITRRNRLTQPLIGRWWQANLYGVDELTRAFQEAGFAAIHFRAFPVRFRYLALWGHIVEAER